MISSRCPLPIGIIESIAFIPVCKGLCTDFLVIIPRAVLSIGKVSFVKILPFPSIGSPRAFTTLPSISSPTGTDTMEFVRFTVSPSFISLSEPSITAPTKSCSRLRAIPFIPFGNSRSSPDIHFSSPCILAIPSPTVTTVPVSVSSIF